VASAGSQAWEVFGSDMFRRFPQIYPQVQGFPNNSLSIRDRHPCLQFSRRFPLHCQTSGNQRRRINRHVLRSIHRQTRIFIHHHRRPGLHLLRGVLSPASMCRSSKLCLPRQMPSQTLITDLIRTAITNIRTHIPRTEDLMAFPFLGLNILSFFCHGLNIRSGLVMYSYIFMYLPAFKHINARDVSFYVQLPL